MDTEQKQEARLGGRAKAFVDYGPLLVFFIAYFFGARLTGLVGGALGRQWCLREGAEMYLAVGAFLPAFAIAFAYSVWREKRIAPMLGLSGVIVGVLGGLTLALQNKTFFYMKPTLIYALFAILLFFGLRTSRNFLKLLFDGALQMPDHAWRTLTVRYAWFFLALAIANEIAWRWLTRDCVTAPTAPGTHLLLGDCGTETGMTCAGEAVWVNVKLFGFTAANILFAVAQAPLFMKHASEEPKG